MPPIALDAIAARTPQERRPGHGSWLCFCGLANDAITNATAMGLKRPVAAGQFIAFDLHRA
jgi:hypothetical protein